MTQTQSANLALFDVITIALACMMIVFLVGQAVPKTPYLVPCEAHLMDRAGISHTYELECELI